MKPAIGIRVGSPIGGANCRQVLDCASALALLELHGGACAPVKRRSTAAVQDAIAWPRTIVTSGGTG